MFSIIDFFHFNLSLGIFHIFCQYLCKLNQLSSWYIIHAVVNFHITLLCCEQIKYLLNDPIKELFNPIPYYDTTIIVAILHVYHLIFFKCTKTDIFHHLFFVTIGSAVVFIFNNGRFVALSHFFICGLPGGIDYIILFLYEQKYVEKITRLNIASHINVWIRAPGLCMVATFGILKFIYSSKDLFSFIELFLQILITYGNGQFYMKEVVYSTGKYTIKEKQD
jgi:hypothetical protein